jgi:hypothetical protein
MRQLAAVLALFAAGAIAAPAHADSPTRSPARGFQWHAACPVDSDYDVDVRPDGSARGCMAKMRWRKLAPARADSPTVNRGRLR